MYMCRERERYCNLFVCLPLLHVVPRRERRRQEVRVADLLRMIRIIIIIIITIITTVYIYIYTHICVLINGM